MQADVDGEGRGGGGHRGGDGIEAVSQFQFSACRAVAAGYVTS